MEKSIDSTIQTLRLLVSDLTLEPKTREALELAVERLEHGARTRDSGLVAQALDTIHSLFIRASE